MEHQFTATIYKFSSNPSFYAVDVPDEVSKALASTVMIPVKGTVNGREWRGTLLPNGSGGHRLILNGEIRKRARIGFGDAVEVCVQLDGVSRDVALPSSLEEALRENDLLDTFNELSRTKRNAAIKWLMQAKTTTTWEKRVESLVMKLQKNKLADIW